MDLEQLEPGRRLEMYVKPTCPSCIKARAFYDAQSYPYTVYDAQNDPAARERMFALANGNPTVPAILVDGSYVQSGWGSPPHG
ncbi:MAG: hypothetical protein NVSMB64_07330 [Candidatus Velthaea sp.]